ncbi:MAG: hypothetical protein ACREF0_00100 [Acetobacteraceae bacterium]
MGFEIEGGAEIRVRIAPRRRSRSEIVEQRVDAGLGNLGILLQIPRRIEQQMRVAPLGCAEFQEVLERIDPAFRDVGILIEVIRGVKQRVRVVALCRADLEIMRVRIDLRGGDLGMAREIPLRIKERILVSRGRVLGLSFPHWQTPPEPSRRAAVSLAADPTSAAGAHGGEGIRVFPLWTMRRLPPKPAESVPEPAPTGLDRNRAIVLVCPP